MVAFTMVYTHAIEDESVDTLQLRLPFGELFQTNLFGMFARDVYNLRVDCIFWGDVLFSQCLEESS